MRKKTRKKSREFLNWEFEINFVERYGFLRRSVQIDAFCIKERERVNEVVAWKTLIVWSTSYISKDIQCFLRSLSGSGRLRHQPAWTGPDWHNRHNHASTYRLRPAQYRPRLTQTGPVVDIKILFLYQHL